MAAGIIRHGATLRATLLPYREPAVRPCNCPVLEFPSIDILAAGGILPQ